MVKFNKKGGILLWIILLIVILAIIGVVTIYFLVTGDNSLLSGLGGNSIPQPPALPN